MPIDRPGQLSSWLMSGHGAYRLPPGAEDIATNRACFIEKTPRVQVPRLSIDIDQVKRGRRGESNYAELELGGEVYRAYYYDHQTSWWIEGGPSNGGRLEDDPECNGHYPAARQWCEEMLKLLGYDTTLPPCLGLQDPHTVVLRRALEDLMGPGRFSIYTAAGGLYSAIRLKTEFTLEVRLAEDNIANALETYKAYWAECAGEVHDMRGAHRNWINGNRTDAVKAMAKMQTANVDAILRNLTEDQKDSMIKFLIQKYVTLP